MEAPAWEALPGRPLPGNLAWQAPCLVWEVFALAWGSCLGGSCGRPAWEAPAWEAPAKAYPKDPPCLGGPFEKSENPERPLAGPLLCLGAAWEALAWEAWKACLGALTLAFFGLRIFARDPDPQPGRSMQGRRPNLRVLKF